MRDFLFFLLLHLAKIVFITANFLSSPPLFCPRVDHWDLEKERVVLLSDNNVISVKYNFILASVEEIKFIPLSHVMEMLVGDFKYPSSYA